MNKTLKKKRVLLLLVALMLIASVGFVGPKTAYAGTQTFVVPVSTFAAPINLINGDFEVPPNLALYTHEDSVPGWDTIAVMESERTSTYAEYFQFCPGYHGNQGIELNADTPHRVYQTVLTQPGSRLLWSFAHNGYYNYNGTYPSATQFDVTSFYVRPAGSPESVPAPAQVVQTVQTRDMTYYTGTYTVPAGLTTAEVGFHPVSTWTGDLYWGCRMDYVHLQTPAGVHVNSLIYTSAPDETYALLGEVVRYNTTAGNWGETDASHCVFHNIFSDYVEYLPARDVRMTYNQNPDYYASANNLASYNAATDELTVNFGIGATAGSSNTNGGILQGSISSSFDEVNFPNLGSNQTLNMYALVTGAIGSVVRNQFRVTYDDSGWENFSPGDFTSYSYVYGRTISSTDPTTYINQFTIADRSIHGRVWYDDDGDGMIDPTEARAGGLTVALYNSTDTTYAAPATDVNGSPLIKTTDPVTGAYDFIALRSGTYKVVLTTPSGYRVTLKTVSTDNDAVAEGSRAVVNDQALTAVLSTTNLVDTKINVDIGLFPDRTVQGVVWYDTNVDGTIDATRTPNWTVGLYLNTDTTYTTPVNDIYGNPLTMQTNASGEYSFSAIPPGTYKVVAMTPSGYSVTVLANDNNAVASGAFAVISNISLVNAGNITNQDIGFAALRTLTVEKRVTGAAADPNQMFTFQISFPGLSISPLSYTGASTVTGVPAPAPGEIYWGSGSVLLRHGQSITIQGIPAGTSYSVAEVPVPSGYSVTISGLLNGSGSSASGTLTDDGSLLFTNTRNTTVPTGVFTDIVPYALMAVLLGGVVALSLTIASKKRRSATRRR